MKFFIAKKIVAIFVRYLISVAFLFDNFSLRWQLSQNQYAQTRVYYSQTDAPDRELVGIIQDAQKYVYFAIYTVTKENIANALIAAKLRGLDVQGVLDYNQSLIAQEKPWLAKFKKYGIKIKSPFKLQGLMHIKMLVTEKAYASGSFNWTVSAATLNDDILEIGAVPGIHDQYLRIFKALNKKYD